MARVGVRVRVRVRVSGVFHLPTLQPSQHCDLFCSVAWYESGLSGGIKLITRMQELQAEQRRETQSHPSSAMSCCKMIRIQWLGLAARERMAAYRRIQQGEERFSSDQKRMQMKPVFVLPLRTKTIHLKRFVGGVPLTLMCTIDGHHHHVGGVPLSLMGTIIDGHHHHAICPGLLRLAAANAKGGMVARGGGGGLRGGEEHRALVCCSWRP
jgi:hypothetical protein